MLLLDGDRRQARAADPQALIEEARRRARRRRIGWLILAVLAGGGTATVALAISGSRSPPTPAGAVSVGGLPTGSLATLERVAGPLAVGANGALYVADVARDRILVRLPDGRFRVVAGNGKVGFSGDGGPALGAELSKVCDSQPVSPAGALYIVDGGRVRVIGSDGVISSIAGSGRALPVGQRIADGTAALAAPLGSIRSAANGSSSISIAVSPSGQLYIATPAQLLRLTSAGTLITVRAVVTSGPLTGKLDLNLDSTAIDGRGNIDVAGVNGWSIWQVTRSGIARQVGYGANGQARRSGGNVSVLERGPGGAVYAETAPPSYASKVIGSSKRSPSTRSAGGTPG